MSKGSAQVRPALDSGVHPNEFARWVVWEDLVKPVAERARLEHSSVRAAATTIPQNLIPMLDCPEGVSALGAYIVGELGSAAIPFDLMVH